MSRIDTPMRGIDRHVIETTPHWNRHGRGNRNQRHLVSMLAPHEEACNIFPGNMQLSVRAVVYLSLISTNYHNRGPLLLSLGRLLLVLEKTCSHLSDTCCRSCRRGFFATRPARLYLVRRRSHRKVIPAVRIV